MGEIPVFSISATERAGSLGSFVVDLTGVAGSSRAVMGIGTGNGAAGVDGPLLLPFAVMGLEVAGAKMACHVS